MCALGKVAAIRWVGVETGSSEEGCSSKLGSGGGRGDGERGVVVGFWWLTNGACGAFDGMRGDKGSKCHGG
jgi:hypothetical protein